MSDRSPFTTHLSRHREFYILFPLKAALVFAAIVFANWLTGRAVIDDPGAIVGCLYSFVPVVVLIGLVGFTQDHLVGFRSEKPNAAFKDDVFDACITFAFFSLFTFVYWLLR